MEMYLDGLMVSKAWYLQCGSSLSLIITYQEKSKVWELNSFKIKLFKKKSQIINSLFYKLNKIKINIYTNLEKIIIS